MAQRHRLTIRSIDADPRAAAIATAAHQIGIPLDEDARIAVADVIFLEGVLDQDALNKLHGFLVDPLLQKGSWNDPTTTGTEITFVPGVTDNAAATLLHAAEQLALPITGAATGRRVDFC